MGNELLVGSVAVPETRAGLSKVEEAVLLTVHYRDLFCHALTLKELTQCLLFVPADAHDVQEAVNELQERYLSRCGEFLTWQGREWLADERGKRLAASARLWRRARHYGQLVRQIPFLRMAGISGSLAVNHAREGRDDVDLFCIAEPNRVWIVMLFLKMLCVYSRRFGVSQLCPNTCLAEDHLEIRSQNLYMAHQIAQVAPLWGGDVYQTFVRKNAWVTRFLPNAFGDLQTQPPAPMPKRGASLVPRWVGDQLNSGICSAGVRKASRFYKATHTDAALRDARNPARYMLPGLGYTGNVFRRFVGAHASRFAGILSREEMETLFGCGRDVFFDARLESGFRWKYENGH